MFFDCGGGGCRCFVLVLAAVESFLSFPFQNRDAGAVKAMIGGVEVPIFTPSTGIKIAVNDSELAQAGSNQVRGHAGACFSPLPA